MPNCHHRNLLTIAISHQREGVDFMIRRESGESTSSLSLWNPEEGNGDAKLYVLLGAQSNNKVLNKFPPSYRHAILGLKTSDPLPGPFGGILADEMGLGKTLTTLATIVSTLKHAEATVLTESSYACGISQKNVSKATLIIVPSEGRPCFTPLAIGFC